MEEAEHSHYVAQLKVEFDSCDTTATGFLDRDELTALCRKLQLDAHLPLLLDTLLGGRPYARVNFEEFKEGFVAVLSRSLDFSTSEDDSSYLEPVVPEEVKPKFVKGTKRYGRRSRPDSRPDAAMTCDSEDSPPSRTEATDSSPSGVRRAKLRRSTSLESVESLKSDEEAGSPKENIQPDFQSKGPQQQEVEVELGVVVGSGGGGGVLTAVCDHLDLQQLNTEDLDVLLRKLDANLDGRVSVRDFQKVLRGSAPVSCSTPVRSADLQRTPHWSQAPLEERSARSTSPSLLTATVGQRVLSRLDEGSGCTSPERVVALWTEEGIRNSRNILQTLDFPLEERLSLADLTLALDNELLVSGNGIHQAALISYKNEIQHLQLVTEQACRERDKVKVDLDQADQRNLQLVREVDDRHASMETLNQSRIRDLEQDFRDRLTALRSQSEQESEALMQQLERERGTLQDELQLLRAQEAELQEELCSTTQENCRLEEDLSVVKLKLTEAESSVNRLQRDLDQLLHDKFGSLDAAGAGLSHEERFSEIVKDYELQCRELRDRNDELSSELDLLKSQKGDRKSRRSAGDDDAALSWTEQRPASTESDSDESDMKRRSSPLVRKKLQPADKTALCSLDSASGPTVSIQTELALEQLKQKHNQELQQLHIKLETQVNYYERSLEVMRQSMEVERKDISQAFKMEISELEEQKTEAEKQVKQLKETLDKLHSQIQHGGGGGWSNEQERRVQRERAELEQNFAREIGNLVQRLSAEKDQLEAELKLKMDQEVVLVREETEQQLSQMKLQHAEGQRRLLHHLNWERQQLQEQRGFWEKRLAESEQEKLRCEEEQARICSQSSEKKSLEEQVSRLQELIHNSHLQISQSETSLEELRGRCGQLEEDLKASLGCCGQLEDDLKASRGRCGQLEDDLKASRGRCSDLEARLEEACNQLEESIAFLESHERLSKRLASEKSCMEEELQQVMTRKEQLLVQVTQLKEELGNLQAASDSILQDREVVADNCSRLSNAFIQQQAQLRAREQTASALRAELEGLQEATRSRAEGLSKLTAELDSLKTDRARLIQDLKDQAMAVDNLQLELDGVSEELNRRRSAEEGLQEALKQEQTRTSQILSGLDEEKEEVCRLSQENRSYARMADQLSNQIVEMEEEISTLRDHLRELSSQLNETADLVLDLRRQLNSKTSGVDRLLAKVADGDDLLRQAKASSEKHHNDLTNQLQAKHEDLDLSRLQVLQLQQDLQDSQDQLRTAEEDFEQEKRKMMQQLMELEKLVLALEEVMDPASPHRTQLEDVRSENGALQERLSVLQQEVQKMEDDVSKRRRKLEEMEREHERSREEEERLHKENSRYREEVLDLSSRNLQLSNDNAELSARLRGDQESVRMLRERLATVSKEQEEEGTTVRRLQDAAQQLEREKLQQQAVWTQERRLLERELSSYKEKLGRLSELEAELSSVTLKLQWLEEDKAKLLREADDRNNKVEKLQQSVLCVESEAELLRSQLHAVSHEKLGHAQEVTELQRTLQDAQSKVEELESSFRRLMREKEELAQALEEQEEQTSVTLQEESHKLRVQNQELQHKLSELQVRGLEVQKLTQQQQNLKTKLNELETERTQAQDQAVRADTALSLVQVQHVRQLQELQQRAGDGCREQVELLQARLLEEQRRSQQLEETLRLQAQHSSSQISMKQDQYEKAMSALQHRMEELETKLKGVQLVLQEKVQQLKDQLAKNTKSSALLKDLYVENSQLMKALQVTEQRQKNAEKKNFLLEDKVNALNKLLREVVLASLAT
ncbi:ninein-like protein isoform X1 [Sebastes umbrosus]|uniref:ninein-like protein isoform X1 n=1 Tax=Sebastes umbrosus TaxID=72105 RepID=UPI00189DE467|nr:ninein-like protein isoform X1 [Sebastes umbrosus]XP_037638025.1 ninein-like protein isoform X1 [Sebastes umbrosus]